jgi:hypothetical protein
VSKFQDKVFESLLKQLSEKVIETQTKKEEKINIQKKQ